MSDVQLSDTLFTLLHDAGSSGCYGVELQRLSRLSENEFVKASEALWNKGYLCGVREESCCGRGCQFMCISYMDKGRIWRLIDHN